MSYVQSTVNDIDTLHIVTRTRKVGILKFRSWLSNTELWDYSQVRLRNNGSSFGQAARHVRAKLARLLLVVLLNLVQRICCSTGPASQSLAGTRPRRTHSRRASHSKCGTSRSPVAGSGTTAAGEVTLQIG